MVRILFGRAVCGSESSISMCHLSVLLPRSVKYSAQPSSAVVPKRRVRHHSTPSVFFRRRCSKWNGRPCIHISSIDLVKTNVKRLSAVTGRGRWGAGASFLVISGRKTEEWIGTPGPNFNDSEICRKDTRYDVSVGFSLDISVIMIIFLYVD